jgi:hypothetical protein
MTYTFRLLLTLLISLSSMPLLAQDSLKKDLEIPATSNVYYNNLKYPRDYYAGGLGTEPVVVEVTGIKVITFENTTGTINLWTSDSNSKSCNADGLKGVTATDAAKGMTGIRCDSKAGFLAGVFLSNSVTPDDPPGSLDFTGREDYTSWGFECQQVFIIGDGRTEKGEPQRILVPAEADRLLLGFADGGIGMARGYDDNKGSIHTTIVLHKKL